MNEPADRLRDIAEERCGVTHHGDDHDCICDPLMDVAVAAFAKGQADQRVRDAAIARRTMIAYERKPLEMLSVYADAVAAAITSSGEELPDEPVKVAGSHGQAFRKSGENPPLAINSAISLIQGEETK